MALLGRGVFLTDPIGYLFGTSEPAVHKTTPAATGSGQAFESVDTTKVIGYAILAGATIYLARKVIGK